MTLTFAPVTLRTQPVQGLNVGSICVNFDSNSFSGSEATQYFYTTATTAITW